VVSGTTGESPTLTHEEKLELFRVVLEEVGVKRLVIAGTGGNDTRTSVELTQEAEKLGVDGAMLVTPYYNKPPQAGLYQHFAR
jgi:4-hydroxy-tetrahydrodipicolinate synthase